MLYEKLCAHGRFSSNIFPTRFTLSLNQILQLCQFSTAVVTNYHKFCILK